MCTDVKTKTEARKAELKAETIELSATVKALNESNKELLTKAPKGKDGKEVLNNFIHFNIKSYNLV
ncbi:hypothetical protein M0Q97_03955 [Candidatus Dojkabacteria bacterium]|jgi:hypothetical protein|nr:hypothetical protein [Candidatus Dojkabacteria bacterium]